MKYNKTDEKRVFKKSKDPKTGKLFDDLTGERFGSIVVQSLSHVARRRYWNCRCVDCGKLSKRASYQIKKCDECRCSSLLNRESSLIGREYGRLKVLLELPKEKRGTFWLCLCECGKLTKVICSKLISGHTKSCGCIARELLLKRNKSMIVHGMTDTRIHNIYCGMMARSYWRSNIRNEKHYSDVNVCERWSVKNIGFVNFLNDMGECPDEKSIDRINPFGDYEPSNCRWATINEQNKNKRADWLKKSKQIELFGHSERRRLKITPRSDLKDRKVCRAIRSKS